MERSFRVGELEIDLQSRELRAKGELVPIQPLTFKLLVYLLENRDRVVTKSELLEAMWPGEVVVPDVLTTAVHALRRALGDDPKKPAYVRTVHRIGYRFIAPADAPATEQEPEFPALAARHETFVGRGTETELFTEMIACRSDMQLLFIYGPPGIGKTTLLQELSYRCRRASVQHVWLCGDSSGPFADTFLRSLAAALGCEEALAGCVRERLRRGPVVIFVDDFHLLSGVEEWMRQELWPVLPRDVRLVLASRSAPSARWRCDPAWTRSARAFDLAPFTTAETEALLSRLGVGADVLGGTHETWRLTRGHPLAIALVADSLRRSRGGLPDVHREDLFDALVEWFTENVCDEGCIRALEAACMLDEVTERSLAALDDPGAAAESMRWLSTLTFVDARLDTLRVHTLVRDAVIRRLRRRSIDALNDLAAKGVRFWRSEFERAPDADAAFRTTKILVGMYRHCEAVRDFYRLSDEGPECTIEAAAGRDLPSLVEAVRRHEGEEAAEITRRWLAHPATRVFAVRDPDARSLGFLLTLQLGVNDRAAVAAAADPVVDAIFRWTGEEIVHEPGDEIIIHRTLIARDDYQAPSKVMRQCHTAMNSAQVWHATHSESISDVFIVYGLADFWGPAVMAAGFARVRQPEVALGGRRFGTFHISLREQPFEHWLEATAAGLMNAAPRASATAGPRIMGAGPHTRIESPVCAACPSSPAGCCAEPPRFTWSDLGRVVACGGRDWLLGELARGSVAPGERGLEIARRRGTARLDGLRMPKCTFHGPRGCTLPHERRPASCNYEICDAALEGAADAARVRAARADRARAFEAWDAALRDRIRGTWSDGPPFDAVFFDWLGSAFATMSRSEVSG